MSSIYASEPPTRGKVLLDTTVGDIEIELWPKEAPMACRNFVQLCMEGYYNNTIFHRVVPGWIVQGGDPTGSGEGGESVYGSPFADEFHSRLRFNRRGLLAMANSGPNDNGSQFFITLAQTSELQKQNTIFGTVVGDSIFNALKLGSGEIDQGTERPVYLQSIRNVQVLDSPFDDIVPRTASSELKNQRAQQLDQAEGGTKENKKKRIKTVKNKKLLSFGVEEDGDEDGEKGNEGMKSSHDLLRSDAALSEKAAVEAKPIHVRTKQEGSAQAAEDQPPQTLPLKDSETSEETMRNEKRQQERKNSSSSELAEMLAPCKKTQSADSTSNTHKKSKKRAFISANENEIFARLGAFQSKIRKSKQGKGSTKAANDKCELHYVNNCESCHKRSPGPQSSQDKLDDKGWLSHSLKFKNSNVGSKDSYTPNADDYVVLDPRSNSSKSR